MGMRRNRVRKQALKIEFAVFPGKPSQGDKQEMTDGSRLLDNFRAQIYTNKMPT